MEERAIHLDSMVITYDQSSEVAQPREGAFDFPPAFVPPQLPAVLRLGFFRLRRCGQDQVDPTLLEPPAQRVRVGGAVVDQRINKI